MPKAICFPLLALAAVALAGCGGTKTVSIRGTVTRGGEKLTWPDGGVLRVIYVAENLGKDPKARTYTCETDTATSSYTLAAIPPGRYYVAIHQFDTKNIDTLRNVFDPGHTEIFREVNQDGQVIDIDLPKDLPKRSKLSADKGVSK